VFTIVVRLAWFVWSGPLCGGISIFNIKPKGIGIYSQPDWLAFMTAFL